MFVRRRPLLRAAAVGGGAYVVGKRRGQRSAENQAAAQEDDSSRPSVSDQLAQLSSLHAQGSISDAEFAAAKSKLLGS